MFSPAPDAIGRRWTSAKSRQIALAGHRPHRTASNRADRRHAGGKQNTPPPGKCRLGAAKRAARRRPDITAAPRATSPAPG